MSGIAIHPRTQIRNKIVNLLKQNVSSKIIHTNRFSKIWPTEFPTIVVFTNDESVDIHTVSPKQLKRSLTVIVEIFEESSTELDNKLDALALEVEKALGRDDTFGIIDEADFKTLRFRIDGSNLINTETNIETDGEMPQGVARLTYSVVYHTMDGVGPETLAGDDFRDLKSVDVDINLDVDPDGEPPHAEITITGLDVL